MSLEGIESVTNALGQTKPCISTAGLNKYLPAIVGAASIVEWGFHPHAKVRAGYWWALEDVPAICDKMVRLIEVAKEKLQ
jgi:hypothetical protein